MLYEIVKAIDTLYPKDLSEFHEIIPDWSKQSLFSFYKKSNHLEYRSRYLNCNHTAIHAFARSASPMPASFGSFLAGQEKNITAPFCCRKV